MPSQASRHIKSIVAANIRETQKRIDRIDEPHRALAEGIFVTPTLLKLSPEPSQTIVGSLNDRKRVVRTLGLGSEPSLQVT